MAGALILAAFIALAALVVWLAVWWAERDERQIPEEWLEEFEKDEWLSQNAENEETNGLA
jgi:beta-lactam-binding protein with PASTA domain